MLKIRTGVQNLIISPAGSIIYNKCANEWLKQHSSIVYLRTPLPIIEERVRRESKAILRLTEKGLAGLMEERAPLYESLADLIIDTENLSPTDISSIVIDHFQLPGKQ